MNANKAPFDLGGNEELRRLLAIWIRPLVTALEICADRLEHLPDDEAQYALRCAHRAIEQGSRFRDWLNRT